MESSMGMVEDQGDSTDHGATDLSNGTIPRVKRTASAPKQPAARVFPFTAIVGQEEMHQSTLTR